SSARAFAWSVFAAASALSANASSASARGLSNSSLRSDAVNNTASRAAVAAAFFASSAVLATSAAWRASVLARAGAAATACAFGRHRRAQDPALGVVESDLLAADRYDRHDRLACLARRHGLGGWRGACLFSLQTRGDRTGLYPRDDRSSRQARANRIALRA